MVDAVQVVAKIRAKSEELLGLLQLEMDLKKWPDDFRSIMWGAVSDLAARRRDETYERFEKGREGRINAGPG